MKKCVLFLVLLLNCYCGFSQNEKNTDKKWTIGLQMNSLDKIPSLLNLDNPSDNRFYNDGTRKNKSFAIGIQANYSFSENCFFRIRSGVTFNNIYEYNEEIFSGGILLGKDYIHITNKNFNLAPGFFFTKRLERFDVFCGFEIPFIAYGQVKDTTSFEQYDRMTDTLTSYVYSHAKSDNGFAVGPAFNAGFNIHLSRNFSLGGETSYAFLYSKVGEISTVTVYSDGPTIVTGEFKDSYEIFFLPSPRFALNLSFHF